MQTRIGPANVAWFPWAISGQMALPQDFEAYGAAPAIKAERRSTRPMRIAFVSAAIVLSMLAAVAFLAKDTEEAARVEDIAVTPAQRLSSMVAEMAAHGDTMSITDMEERLEEWRHNPDTILDMPEHARTQVSTCAPTVF